MHQRLLGLCEQGCFGDLVSEALRSGDPDHPPELHGTSPTDFACYITKAIGVAGKLDHPIDLGETIRTRSLPRLFKAAFLTEQLLHPPHNIETFRELDTFDRRGGLDPADYEIREAIYGSQLASAVGLALDAIACEYSRLTFFFREIARTSGRELAAN